jgi:hypothetical protein
MTKRNAPARRDFLKTTVWGGSCLAFGLAAARRQAEATGQPVLTEASFNQMMREAQASGQIKQMAAEASRDLEGWLQRHFTLTPVQLKRIQAMPPATVQQISQALVPISQKGGTIRISMSEQRAQTQARTQELQKRAQEAKKKVKELEEEAGDSGFFKKIIGVSAKEAGGTEKHVSFTLSDRAVLRQSATPLAPPKQPAAQTTR